MIFCIYLTALLSLCLAAGGQESRDGTAESPTTLPAFVIQLDQKFFAELSSMAASYTDLFSQNGRQKLVQVALHICCFQIFKSFAPRSPMSAATNWRSLVLDEAQQGSSFMASSLQPANLKLIPCRLLGAYLPITCTSCRKTLFTPLLRQYSSL